MNVAALTLLGLAAAQPAPEPTADYVVSAKRSLEFPITAVPEYKKDILKFQLFVCQGQSGVWELAKEVLPDQDKFTFTAKDDGIYWATLVTVFRNGKRDVADPSQPPSDRIAKVLIDTTPPTVEVTSARRDGDEVAVEWRVTDKFPNEAATRVLYKPVAGTEGDWQAVPAAGLAKRSARFKPGVAGPLSVRVEVADLAGNPGAMSRDVPAATTAFSPPAPAGGLTAATASTPGPLPPPVLPSGAGLTAPSLSPPAPGGLVEPAPVATPPAAPEPPAAPANPAGWSPVGTAGPDPAGPRPIAVGTGPSAAPPAEAAAGVQVINYLRFDLQYQVENGPSGVSRVDLYVTRDDGRTWAKWSQHDGRESPLRVVLDTKFNQQPEGDYGLHLVPVSGAGLSDGPPAPGTPPGIRAHVDVTPPVIKVYPPTADPTQRNTLVLHWEATDRNFGKDPIAIEWSEHPTGPWRGVTADAGGVVPVVAGPGAGPARLPNTGSFPWALPAGLATHKVFLKFTAWDAAGNRSEVVTPSPVLVDLTKPRARIQGIAGGTASRP